MRNWLGGGLGWLRCLEWLTFCAILLAAFSKMLSLHEFAGSIREWSLVPPSVLEWIAVAVPSCEFIVVYLRIEERHAQAARTIVLGMLIAITSAAGVQWAVLPFPNCHCFAVLERYWQDRAGIEHLAIRNGVPIACVIPAWLSSKGRTR